MAPWEHLLQLGLVRRRGVDDELVMMSAVFYSTMNSGITGTRRNLDDVPVEQYSTFAVAAWDADCTL